MQFIITFCDMPDIKPVVSSLALFFHVFLHLNMSICGQVLDPKVVTVQNTK